MFNSTSTAFTETLISQTYSSHKNTDSELLLILICLFFSFILIVGCWIIIYSLQEKNELTITSSFKQDNHSKQKKSVKKKHYTRGIFTRQKKFADCSEKSTQHTEGEVTPSYSYSINVTTTSENLEEPLTGKTENLEEPIYGKTTIFTQEEESDSELDQEVSDEKVEDEKKELHQRQESLVSLLNKYIFRKNTDTTNDNKTASFDFSYIFPPTPVVGDSTSDASNSDHTTTNNNTSSKFDFTPQSYNSSTTNYNNVSGGAVGSRKSIVNSTCSNEKNYNAVNYNDCNRIHNVNNKNKENNNHCDDVEDYQQTTIYPNTISTNRTIDNTFESSNGTGDRDGDIEDQTTESEELEINMNNIYARNHIVPHIDNKGGNQKLFVIKGEKPDHDFNVKNVIKPLSKYLYKTTTTTSHTNQCDNKKQQQQFNCTKQQQQQQQENKEKQQKEEQEEPIFYKKDPFYSCKSPFYSCKSPLYSCQSPLPVGINNTIGQLIGNKQDKINIPPKRNLYSRNNAKARESKEFLRAHNFQSDNNNKRTPEIHNFWYNQKLVE